APAQEQERERDAAGREHASSGDAGGDTQTTPPEETPQNFFAPHADADDQTPAPETINTYYLSDAQLTRPAALRDGAPALGAAAPGQGLLPPPPRRDGRPRGGHRLHRHHDRRLDAPAPDRPRPRLPLRQRGHRPAGCGPGRARRAARRRPAGQRPARTGDPAG